MHGFIRYLVIAFGLMISLGNPAQGAIDFAPAVNYPVGTNPTGLVVGDFNGDGKLDIATANSVDQSVSILLGNGDGTFMAATVFNVGLAPVSIAVGDFNNDGKLDLAVFRQGDRAAVTGAVSILLGKGDGTFQAPQTLTLTLTAAAMAVADFNLDKKSDLAVSNYDPNSGNVAVDIFLGKGDGTFQAAKATPVVPSGAVVFTVADFDNDTKPDLAIVGSGGVTILRGQGDGTFVQGAVLPVSFLPNAVSAADFNGNGKMDLILKTTATRFSRCGVFFSTRCKIVTDSVIAFAGNGDGTFQTGQNVASATTSQPEGGGSITGSRILGPPAVGDFNGDGKQDVGYLLASALLTNPSLVLKLGKGDGTFTAGMATTKGIFGSRGGSIVAAADLNGDKLSDLITLQTTANNISVVLNTSPASGADLRIASAGASPEPVGVKRNLTYTADVNNLGPKDATGVTFTDTLPNGASFVSASATQGSCTQSNLVVTCNLGTLASPLDAVVTIIAMAPTTTGAITNSMNVTATEPDLVPTNNPATQNSTVVPVFKLTAAITGNGSGTVTSDPGLDGPLACGSTCTASYLSGTSLNVTAIPGASSLLANWSGACSGDNNPCTITMDGDKKVTANFVIGKKLTATLAGTGTGIVVSASGALSCPSSASPCTALFLPGASVVLTGNSDSNSFFGSWGGACSGTTNSCTVTMDVDKSVTADFILGKTLSVTLAGLGTGSVTSNSGGINCASGPCSAVYPPGTVVSLTAVPDGTSVFESWSGACTGTDPKTCSVTMNADLAVTSTFNPPRDFSMTSASPALTVQHGARATVGLTLASQGGLASVLSLTCSVAGPAPLPPCNLNPASVTLGSTPVTSALTVDTSGLSAALAPASTPTLAHGFYALVLPLWLIGGVVAVRNQKEKRRSWLICAFILLAAILPVACGSQQQAQFVPKTFTVTVQAKDGTGAFNHSTVIMLTVQ